MQKLITDTSQALYSMQSEYIQAVTLEKQSSWYRELCSNTVHVLTVSGRSDGAVRPPQGGPLQIVPVIHNCLLSVQCLPITQV